MMGATAGYPLPVQSRLWGDSRVMQSSFQEPLDDELAEPQEEGDSVFEQGLDETLDRKVIESANS